MLIVETSFRLIKHPLLPVKGLCGQWVSSHSLPFQISVLLCPISSSSSSQRSLSYKDPNCSSGSRKRTVNSPETQRSFAGSGHPRHLWLE